MSETSLGGFCWHELMTNDLETAKSFYTQLFGWEIPEQESPLGGRYDCIQNAGCGIGGMMLTPEGVEAPPHWNGYVHVTAADAAANRAKDHGGNVIVPGLDIPGMGRFSCFQDTDGAVVSAWQNAEGAASEDARKDGVPGSFCWNELNARNLDGAKAFYGEVFGWTSRDMDMGPMGTYVIFASGDQDRCGAMKLPPDAPHPPHWMFYVAVESADAAFARVKELGGAQFVPPTDIPGAGRFAIVADPTGAAFGVYQGNG